MKPLRAILVLVLLFIGAFTLGTLLQNRGLPWASRAQSESILQVMLGDSRRLFASHFYVKADVYFHSGLYPSIFDQARENEAKENHMAAARHDDHTEHEEGMDFLGQPTDWIDRFGRRFRVAEHTHLEGGSTREMLPWLRMSAELDPQRVETYLVASYWLRRELGKAGEAEQFLREGLRANPDSYEILFELGRLHDENRHDPIKARNLWLMALRRWHEREDHQKEPNLNALHGITLDLAKLEAGEKNYAQAIEWLEMTKTNSSHAEELQRQIDELKAKLGNAGSDR